MVRLTLALLLIWVFLAPISEAQINKEKVILCSGAAVCPLVTNVVKWGANTRAEYSLDSDTGCNKNTKYEIRGANTGGDILHTIATLSLSTTTSQAFIEAIWYPAFIAVPSNSAGCTDLQISIWVDRPPPRR